MFRLALGLALMFTSALALAKRIDPVGDEDLAYFKFVAPADAPAVAGSLSGDFNYNISGLNEVRVQPVNYCLQFATAFVSTIKNCSIKLAPKQKFAFDLLSTYGILETATSHEFFRVDFGQALNTHVNAVGKDINLGTTAPDYHVWVEPGDYQFTVSTPAGDKILLQKTARMTAGDREKLDLTFPDQRVHLTLYPSPTADFPDYTEYGSQVPNAVFLVDTDPAKSSSCMTPVPTGPSMYEANPLDINVARGVNNKHLTARDLTRSCGIKESLELVPGKEIAFYDSGLHTRLVVNNVPYYGTFVQGQNTIQMKRIDVNDVTVTRENGTQYVTAGTFSFTQKNPNGQWLPMGLYKLAASGGRVYSHLVTEIPTQHGVNVPPGEYTVTVKFKTEVGPQTKEFYVDLR